MVDIKAGTSRNMSHNLQISALLLLLTVKQEKDQHIAPFFLVAVVDVAAHTQLGKEGLVSWLKLRLLQSRVNLIDIQHLISSQSESRSLFGKLDRRNCRIFMGRYSRLTDLARWKLSTDSSVWKILVRPTCSPSSFVDSLSSH